MALYIKDNFTGDIHEYGTDEFDTLVINKNGSIHYKNLDTGKGTMDKGKYGYTFVSDKGIDIRKLGSYKYGRKPYIDFGSTRKTQSNPIEHIEVVRDTSWLKEIEKEFNPTRAELIFDK